MSKFKYEFRNADGRVCCASNNPKLLCAKCQQKAAAPSRGVNYAFKSLAKVAPPTFGDIRSAEQSATLLRAVALERTSSHDQFLHALDELDAREKFHASGNLNGYELGLQLRGTR